jgi:phosphocarrier protein HPr
MPERVVTVGSRTGLHARPAALFVQAAGAAPIPVRIAVAGRKPVDARSMLAVLSLGATQGTQVILYAEGDQADEALDSLAALLEQDLDA